MFISCLLSSLRHTRHNWMTFLNIGTSHVHFFFRYPKTLKNSNKFVKKCPNVQKFLKKPSKVWEKLKKLKNGRKLNFFSLTIKVLKHMQGRIRVWFSRETTLRSNNFHFIGIKVCIDWLYSKYYWRRINFIHKKL